MSNKRDREREYHDAILSVRQRFRHLPEDVLKAIISDIDKRDFIILELEDIATELKNALNERLTVEDDFFEPEYAGSLMVSLITPVGLTWDQVRKMIHVLTTGELVDYMMMIDSPVFTDGYHEREFRHIEDENNMDSIRERIMSLVGDKVALEDYVYSMARDRTEGNPDEVYQGFDRLFRKINDNTLVELKHSNDDIVARGLRENASTRRKAIVHGFLYTLLENQLFAMRRQLRQFTPSRYQGGADSLLRRW